MLRCGERNMVTIRSAKNKGSQFEYSVFDSLKPIYPNVRLTKQLGFVQQYDLIDESEGFVIECKRLKGFSWNELAGYFEKLISKSNGKRCYLIFRGNRQPCLVMYLDEHLETTVKTFENVFNTPFVDRQKKKVDTTKAIL
jgi:hypothetical protein